MDDVYTPKTDSYRTVFYSIVKAKVALYNLKKSVELTRQLLLRCSNYVHPCTGANDEGVESKRLFVLFLFYFVYKNNPGQEAT